MAIYHLDVSVISRSAGRSATAAAAYRLATRIEDHRTGLTHDYHRKTGVIASGIVGWPTDSNAELWNAAESAENRRNACTAREVMIALPAELSTEDQARLVRGFAAHLRDRYGVAATWTIHTAPKGGDERNRHAHILMTTRKVDAAGRFGEKTRALDDRKQGPEEIKAIRLEWEQRVNRALERAGSRARVSSKRQNIEPLEHLGPVATAKERRGIKTAAGNRNRRRLKSRARAQALVAEIQSIEREQAGEEQALTEQQHAQAAAVWRGVLDNTKTVDDRAKRLTAQLAAMESSHGRQAVLPALKSAAPVAVRRDCWSVMKRIAEEAAAIAVATYRALLEEVARLASRENDARLRQRQHER
jgi:hypothetical protein